MNVVKKNIIISLLAAFDSDDEDDFIINYILNHKSKRKRTAIQRYVENVIPLYDFDDFRAHFRLNRTTFACLLQVIGPYLQKEENTKKCGRNTNSPEKQLLVALSMLVNEQVYRIVAEKFNISKSTAWIYLHKVSSILTNMSVEYIKWPTGGKVNETMNKFKERQGFPGVLGVMDGTHIPITAPANDQTSYCNRKGYHSIILQATCDADYIFTDVFTGYPGSVHDSRVFQNSPLNKKITECPNETFPQNTHILADSAYKCSGYILTPYRNNGHLNERQKIYNFKHSSTRVFIEQCFGLLKGHFRILKHINIYKTKLIPKIIIACCVLHNICMQQKDSEFIEIDIDDDDKFNVEIYDHESNSVIKRDVIANILE